MSAFRFVARVAIATIFLASAYNKITGFDHVVPLVQSQMAANTPYNPPLIVAKLCLAIAVALELVGGVLLILGKEALGATFLLAFLVSVSPIMHAFWNKKGKAAEEDMISFMKNFTMVGTMLYVIAVNQGAGKAKKH